MKFASSLAVIVRNAAWSKKKEDHAAGNKNRRLS